MCTVLPHVDDFLLNLQANKYSAETIYNYERDLNVFGNFRTKATSNSTRLISALSPTSRHIWFHGTAKQLIKQDPVNGNWIRAQ